MGMLLADSAAFGGLLRSLRLGTTMIEPRPPYRLLPLSQNGLALAAGVNAALINRLERGLMGSPGRSTVLAIARALGADELATDELLTAAGHCPEILACLHGEDRRAVLRRLWEGTS